LSHSFLFFFFFLLRPPLSSSLFPYTTLFRSVVSVIIAALDAHGTLGAAIDSVLAQDLSEFEIVIAPDEAADYSGFAGRDPPPRRDRKSTRLNSSHLGISYAVFCLKKKKKIKD